ncbi:uncharacterized protein LOC118736239 [Rhagoletis pomonella]|uniref:uncharacterized protein LOC118736239 n=1 Tax=Rhagoletis pomonella TaxID=28610 RepID=UPI00177E18B8|nr:uncharacterized protein LOC118736239 [Rhagoletis pomonella]
MDNNTLVVPSVIWVPRKPDEVRIEGIGSSTAVYTRGNVTVKMQPTIDSNTEFRLEAYVVPMITSTTPSATIDPAAWTHLKDLPLADPTFGSPGRVDLLLGAEVLKNLFLEGLIRGSAEQPCALNTRLGWVVFGPAHGSSPQSVQLTSHAVKRVNEQRLDKLLRSFWELEEPAVVSETREDDCERVFTNTFTRATDGRYQVQIIFKPDAPSIGDSYQSA